MRKIRERALCAHVKATTRPKTLCESGQGTTEYAIFAGILAVHRHGRTAAFYGRITSCDAIRGITGERKRQLAKRQAPSSIRRLLQRPSPLWGALAAIWRFIASVD